MFAALPSNITSMSTQVMIHQSVFVNYFGDQRFVAAGPSLCSSLPAGLLQTRLYLHMACFKLLIDWLTMNSLSSC